MSATVTPFPTALARKASPLMSASILLLHAVDAAGGQGQAGDDDLIWDRPIEHRPLITWAQVAALRRAVADLLAPGASA